MAPEGKDASMFADMLQGAIERTALRPSTQRSEPTGLDLLTNASTGPVGEARSQLVSEVASADPSAAGAEKNGESALQAATEARMRALYLDLTNYQVAWRIAQRMQQDISQLLRGM